MKYHAFISYSHRDKAWGDWLHKALETYKVPKALVGRPTDRGEPVPARLFPVFRDREELPTSTSLHTAIQDALRQSRYLIVICSPHSANSMWVNEEILEYKRLGREDRVLAIIVEGIPNATDSGDPAQECFPPALRFRLGPDGELSTARTEPIAADACDQGDGKQNALLKLLAGVLGVNYDDLKRRDEEYRRRQLMRLRALVAGFALLAAAATVAGILAIQAKRQAVENLGFAYRATDNLALDIARELESNYNIPSREKLYFFDRLEHNFGQLVTRSGDPEIKRRYAELLTTGSLVLMAVGQQEAAAHHVERAHGLAFPLPSSGENPLVSGPQAARIKLALALSQIEAMRFAAAGTALDEAAAQMDRQPGASDEVLIQVRIMRTRARLFQLEGRFDQATAEHRNAMELIAQAENAPTYREFSAAARQHLFVELFELHLLQPEIAAGKNPDQPAASPDTFQRDLDRGKPVFAEQAAALWAYYAAAVEMQRAAHERHQGRAAEAMETLSKAIAQLHRSTREDPHNLRCRAALAVALQDRARLAVDGQDYVQAEADLDSVDALTLSLKYDSGADLPIALLDWSRSDARGKLALARNTPSTALRAFTTLVARLERPGTDPSAQTLTDQWALNGLLGLQRTHLLQQDHPQALAVFRQFISWQTSGPSGDLLTLRDAYLRYFACAALLPYARESAFDEAVWQEVHRLGSDTIAAALQRDPTAKPWLERKAYWSALLGRHLIGQGKSAEAVQAYQTATTLEAGIVERDNATGKLSANLVLYLRDLLTAQVAAKDVPGAMETIAKAQGWIDPVDTPALARKITPAWLAFAQTLKQIADEANDTTLAQQYAASLARTESTTRRLQTLGESVDLSASPDAPRIDFRVGSLLGLVAETSRGLNWDAPPIYPAAWRTLVGAELSEAEALFAGSGQFPDLTAAQKIRRFRVATLPFYDHGQLFEAEYTHVSGLPMTVGLLVVNGKKYALKGTSVPLHEANEKGPIRLDSYAQVAAYLRFFAAHLRSDENSFQLVEHGHELPWAPDASFQLRQDTEKLIRPVAVWPDPKNPGWWLASGSVWYGNTLAHALFSIRPDGMVEMTEDFPVTTSLPLVAPKFNAGGRSGRPPLRFIDLGDLMRYRENSEIETLLQSRPDSSVHSQLQRASEAAILSRAYHEAGIIKFPKLLQNLRQATAIHLEANAHASAYPLQEVLVQAWRAKLATAEPGDPRLPPSQQEFAGELAALARLALLTGDLEQARRLAREALAIDPRQPMAIIQLAHANAAGGDHQAALDIYRTEAGRMHDDRPWLTLAEEELSRLETVGVKPREIRAFAQVLRENRTSFPPPGSKPEPAPNRFPSYSTEEWPSDTSPGTNSLFERCDFMLGKNSSIVVVIPAVLPKGELELYVDWYHLTFVVGGKTVAHLRYQGGEVRTRLLANEHVGLVEYLSGTDFPSAITTVAKIKKVTPDVMPP